MQLLTSALAGDPSVVKESYAAPHGIAVHVWIDNIRLCGDVNLVQSWSEVIRDTALLAQVDFGGISTCVTHYTFIGVAFNHVTETVHVGDKSIRRLRSTKTWDSMNAGDIEQLAARLVYASGVLGFALFEFYFFFKFVRRLLSKLNKGYITLTTPVTVPPMTRVLGDKLLARVLQHNVRQIVVAPSSEPPTIVTDASNFGWGAVFFSPDGEVFVSAGRWGTVPTLIMQAEARAVMLGILHFGHRIKNAVRILIDNTSVLCALRKRVVPTPRLF